MKSLIIVFLITFTNIGFAYTASELQEKAEQFKNRNWNIDALMLIRKVHIMDYSSTESLTASKNYAKDYADQLEALSFDQASMFYPIEDFGAYNDVVSKSDFYASMSDNYNTMLSMGDFLTVLATEKWEDESSGCSGDDLLNNANCGRETKGEYVLNNLTGDQRDGLSTFIEIVLDEMQLISTGYFDVAPGPELFRIFQFLYDDASIARIINAAYLSESQNADIDVYKKNVIALIRAIFVQVFKGTNGSIENSQYHILDLEDNTCFSKTQNLDCQLTYLRGLLADYSGTSSLDNPNQIFDYKAVEAIGKSYVTNFKRIGYSSVDNETLLETGANILETIALIFDDAQSTQVAEMNVEFKVKLLKQLKALSEYFIRERDVIGLQISKALGDVMKMLQ